MNSELMTGESYQRPCDSKQKNVMMYQIHEKHINFRAHVSIVILKDLKAVTSIKIYDTSCS